MNSKHGTTLFLCKKAKVKLAKLQISYRYLAKGLLPSTGKKATMEKRLRIFESV